MIDDPLEEHRTGAQVAIIQMTEPHGKGLECGLRWGGSRIQNSVWFDSTSLKMSMWMRTRKRGKWKWLCQRDDPVRMIFAPPEFHFLVWSSIFTCLWPVEIWSKTCNHTPQPRSISLQYFQSLGQGLEQEVGESFPLQDHLCSGKSIELGFTLHSWTTYPSSWLPDGRGSLHC